MRGAGAARQAGGRPRAAVSPVRLRSSPANAGGSAPGDGEGVGETVPEAEAAGRPRSAAGPGVRVDGDAELGLAERLHPDPICCSHAPLRARVRSRPEAGAQPQAGARHAWHTRAADGAPRVRAARAELPGITALLAPTRRRQRPPRLPGLPLGNVAGRRERTTDDLAHRHPVPSDQRPRHRAHARGRDAGRGHAAIPPWDGGIGTRGRGWARGSTPYGLNTPPVRFHPHWGIGNVTAWPRLPR